MNLFILHNRGLTKMIFFPGSEKSREVDLLLQAEENLVVKENRRSVYLEEIHGSINVAGL